MNILISGAGGFIGSHLMDAFPEAVGFDNWLTGRKENNSRVTTLDILDRPALYNAANEVKPDVVIHCAASYSDPDRWHRDVDINVAGGINAAIVARHHKAHLVYFQTILPPISSYAISKIASEQYQRMSGVPLTVLRLANIYGPRNLSGPIPVFYKRLTEGKDCFAVDTTRDMVYIDDLVRAVIEVVGLGRVGTFDVCSGIQTPIIEMYDAVRDSLGLHVSANLVPPLADDVQGTVSSAQWVPGWHPTIDLASGIDWTVRSYDHHGVQQTHTHLRLPT